MRIVAKVAGAGSNGLTRIPYLGVDNIDDNLCNERGELDEAKCRKQLALLEELGVLQFASDDSIPVLAFTTELLRQAYNAVKGMIENRDRENNRAAHAEAETADDRHAERNMKRGRFVFVRMDVRYSAVTRTIKFALDVQNPKGVVGVAEVIAKEYALIIARIANHIADELTASHSTWEFDFRGGEGYPEVFAEARKVEAKISCEKCERRTEGGYCSPAKFDCPFYKNGKCNNAE